MTETSWIVTLALGGIGGGLNAVLSDRACLWPSLVTLSPGRTRILRLGIVGSIVMGAVTAVCLCWVIQKAGASLSANGGLGLAVLGFCNLFIAFLASRWVTNEVDKLVLRKAVFKAASAPAAHPDFVDEMALAPPYTLYTLVDRLLPRRAGHR